MPSHLIQILATALLCCPATGQESPVVPNRTPEQLNANDTNMIRRIRLDALTRRLRLRPMSQARLREIADRIGLTGTARENWSYLIQQYESDWKRLGSETSDEILQLRLAAYQWDERAERFEPRPVSELIDLEQAAESVRRVIDDLETALLDELPMMATEQHVDDARALVFQRAMERYWRPGNIPGSETDLTRIVMELDLESETEIDEEILEAVRSRLESYRKEIREARNQHALLHDRNFRMHAEEIVGLGPMPEHAVDEEARRQVRKDRDERGAELHEQEFALRRINEKHLMEIQALLPTTLAGRLRERWNVILGGNHVEEQAQLEALVARMMSELELEARSMKAIESVPDEVRSQNRLVDEEITAKEVEIEGIEQSGSGAGRDARLLLARSKLLELQAKRRKRMIVGLQTIAGILGSDAPETSRSIFDLEASLKARIDSDLELSKRSRSRAEQIERSLMELEEERLIEEATALQKSEEAAGSDGDTATPDEESPES